MQSFLEAMDPVRVLRNSVQHLEARFDKLVKLREPTWGVITWLTVEEEHPFRAKLHMVVAGAIRNGEFPVDNPLGRSIQPPIDLVRLRAHGHTVLLTETLAAISELAAFLESKLSRQFKGKVCASADVYAEVTVEAKEGSGG